MSRIHTLTQRSPAITTLVVGLVAGLALMAGPARADTGSLQRVTVNGRVVDATTRYDIRNSCPRAATQLQDELNSVRRGQSSDGHFEVSFLVSDGEVSGARARGDNLALARQVRQAVNHLQCPMAGTGTYVYRLQVVLLDPSEAGAATPQAAAGAQVALIEKR